MGKFDEYLTFAWNEVLLEDCTKEQLIECINWLAGQNDGLRKECKERAMARIVRLPRPKIAVGDMEPGRYYGGYEIVP